MFERVAEYINQNNDERIQDKFLMSSPLPTVILIAIYLITIKLILPSYMKNRPAFKANKAIALYNIFQVILSATIVYLGFGSGWIRRFSIFKCRDVDRNVLDSDANMAMNAVYLFFLAKFSEFFDTIFFILRKKFNQVSFLHLYHHATMPFNCWLMVKLAPGGSMAMAVGLNSLVHVVMYTYYLLAGLGPHMQKYLWWKKYLTAFQLVQFTFAVFKTSLIIFGDCPTMLAIRPLLIYYNFYIASLLLLFAKFYNDSYNKKQSDKDLKTKSASKSVKIN